MNNKFRFYDPDLHKMFDVLSIDFEGRPRVVIQRRPTFRRTVDLGYLMQFTGLHDKNGVDIYEGDVLRVANDWGLGPQSVWWNQKTASWNVGPQWFLGSLCDNNTVEVIGNIHENPELLGDK